MEKFKCDVVQCAEENGNCKALQCLELMKEHSTAVETQGSDQRIQTSQTKFTALKRGQFPENDDAVFKCYFSYGMYSGSIIFPKSSSQP
jgi:hypothetical protein